MDIDASARGRGLPVEVQRLCVGLIGPGDRVDRHVSLVRRKAIDVAIEAIAGAVDDGGAVGGLKPPVSQRVGGKDAGSSKTNDSWSELVHGGP